MSTFSALRFVSQWGIEAPYDPLDERSPHNQNWFDNEIARRVTQSGIRTIRWDNKDKTIEIGGTFLGGVALDRSAELLVVITDKPRVYNPDGSVNHEIAIPSVVEAQDYEGKFQRYPVEGVAEVVDQDGHVLVDLEFSFERIERRHYSAASRQWLGRTDIFRR